MLGRGRGLERAAMVGAIVVGVLALGSAVGGAWGVRWGLLGWSLAWAVGIAVLGTGLGWIGAWGVRWSRAGGAGVGLMVLPLLVPSYLAYHSLGQHRAPLTRLGDLVETLAKPDMSGPGWEWLPVLVGRGIAGVGLSLWVWPLAMLVLLGNMSGIRREMVDALRGSGAGRLRVQRVALRACADGIVRSVALLTLVMLGSAVPLHLAQAPTYAIEAWQSIMLDPSSTRPWIASWPVLVVMGGLLSWLVLDHRARARQQAMDAHLLAQDHDDADSSRRVSLCRVLAGVLLGCSVVLPLVSYAIGLQRLSSIVSFWRVSREAIGQSVLVASCAALVLAGMMLLAWSIEALRRERLGGWGSGGWGSEGWTPGGRTSRGQGLRFVMVALLGLVVGVLALGAIVPGIMVGHAWWMAAVWCEMHLGEFGVLVRDGWGLVVLAHVSRFGLLALLLGVWLAAREDPGLRDARRLALPADASIAARARAWARAEVVPRAGLVVGVVLAFSCLSLHEIEATIVLQAPGTSSLAQTLIQQLHFARQEEISAGALLLLTPATLVAGLGAWLLGAGLMGAGLGGAGLGSRRAERRSRA